MQAVKRRCCGIDVHKKQLMVHVLPGEGDAGAKPVEREFGTFTRDLRGLREWLKSNQVTEVVIESTGQYWRPVWNILEGEIPGLMLVNPNHVSREAIERQPRATAAIAGAAMGSSRSVGDLYRWPAIR